MSRAEPPDGKESSRFEAALPEELLMARLPTGRHGLPRSFIESNQRLRIIAAMLRVLPDRGFPATTIGDITSEASVSRAAFYEHFADKEACFVATFDFCARWLCEQIEVAVEAEADWRDRIRSGIAETLSLLAANPLVAHLIAIECAQVGRVGRQRQQALQGSFAVVLREGHSGRADIPNDFADLLLGGALSLVARYVDAGRAEQLVEATRTLVEFVLIPYLGAEEASAALAGLPESDRGG
ncbi:MAG: TetR/AcrR family transcriptional regulator [Solirubrobacterales bacterium]